jgi:hypothetical protein
MGGASVETDIDAGVKLLGVNPYDGSRAMPSMA